MRKLFQLFAITLLLSGCTTVRKNIVTPTVNDKSIVILYDNDVHCNIKGYATLAGYRDAVALPDTSYVALTSSGDFINGDVAGAISLGQYVVDVMSHVGYDAITLGNHEFDFGVPRMQEILPQIKAPVICANLFAADSSTPLYKPYLIKTYGMKRIAFIGVCTPESMTAEEYSFYDKKGTKLYDLKPAELNTIVQKTVDEVRSQGVDYVVVLSHMGEEDTGFGTSQSMISGTHGIDVVLDAHTHSVLPCYKVNNSEGKPVLVSQTGTQFTNIGKLVITREGKITTELISTAEMTYSNPVVEECVDSVFNVMKQKTDRIIGKSDFELTISDSNGHRLTRNGETNLGDISADALRYRMKADIGLQNGGGIRNGIPAGIITYGHCVGSFPFYNLVCMIETTGQQILDMLVACTALYPKEDGNFPHVSGMKYTLHGSSHTISDVKILNAETGLYEDLRLDGLYTIATTDYYANGGFAGKLKQATLLEQTRDQTSEVLGSYIEKKLGGDIDESYRSSQSRLTIIDD